MRTEFEVSTEIREIEDELRKTPPGSPNIGHLLTIRIGLVGELEDIKKEGKDG